MRATDCLNHHISLNPDFIVRVPTMWDFGGSIVVILPSGVNAFRLADGDVHDPATLALATERIRAFCYRT